MIAIAIAIIRYMSGTTDDPKAAPQVREMTKHRSKPRSIEGLTMEIKRERARKGLPEMTRPLMEMPDYKPRILTPVEIEENRRKRNARKRAERARKLEAERKQIAKFGSLNYKLRKLLATIKEDSQKKADGNGAWSKKQEETLTKNVEKAKAWQVELRDLEIKTPRRKLKPGLQAERERRWSRLRTAKKQKKPEQEIQMLQAAFDEIDAKIPSRKQIPTRRPTIYHQR
jgi:hypothetical protein